ncbi:MAG: ECF transporter S component [Yaniella sp.]|uniref:ECF transporter S component n=1 Tax=Yaniella sp. TaxID=2773929 RepID=UPI0026488E63|nr:ECF transporter S component [Yaniella sp.]MDN5704709.1 ECF transporter S component [Yaniella sp.]MDN5731914.1 ECF transporter S component [Yaniella sp.]MDN5815704.1 ECF transporter S component [Yaniella sp.]MDN5818717.1 ECF transporter S component [Yaniella sp.]MDN5838877.1 ECF transporter S component [Yaniella sp.]
MTGTFEQTTPKYRNPFDSPWRWQLKDLVLVVVLGVVFGFVYWALVQASNGLAIVMGPAGDLAHHFLHGGWLLVAPLAVAITRKAGSGILAEMLAAAIEFVFLGSPAGPTLLITGLLQGLGSELPFAIGRYKRFGISRYAVSGFLGAFLIFWFSAIRSGWFGQDILLLRLVIHCSSGIILGGILAYFLVRAVQATGVVDNYAIGRYQ